MNKKERTRLRIAEALLSLLTNSPIQDIYIVDLIAEAEISKRTFYNYFSDKHDVISWWWKFQLRDYRKGNLKDYIKQQMYLIREYRLSLRNVMGYTGQNNFLEDAIAHETQTMQMHIRKEILNYHSLQTANNVIELSVKSGWNFILELLEDPKQLEVVNAQIEKDPGSIVMAGSLNLLVPFISYPYLPEGKGLYHLQESLREK